MSVKAKVAGTKARPSGALSASPEEKVLQALFGEKNGALSSEAAANLATRRKAAALASLDRNHEALALLSKA